MFIAPQKLDAYGERQPRRYGVRQPVVDTGSEDTEVGARPDVGARPEVGERPGTSASSHSR